MSRACLGKRCGNGPFSPTRWREGGDGESRHRDIVRWFADDPNPSCSFSLHHLVAMGEKSGKRAGDWYGPSSVAHLLGEAMEKATKQHLALRNICLYVAQDCTVYMGDVARLCEKQKEGSSNGAEGTQWKSLILLLPTRLGADKLNPGYTSSLMQFLTLKACLGIIGGRPRHSLYFIGFQEKKLIHLDPHYCQEVVQVDHPNFPLGSFHCKSPRKLDVNKMDPSCCIGFYCKTKKELDALVDFVKSMQEEYPIISFNPGCNLEMENYASRSRQTEAEEESISIVTTANDSNCESEEFVLLM